MRVKSYQRLFPGSIPDRAAAQAYDLVLLVSGLLGKVGANRGLVKAELSQMDPYFGISGVVSPGRLPVWEPNYLLEVRGGELHLLRAEERQR